MTSYADLQQMARGKVCVLCSSEPRIAVLEGEYRLRCNCVDAITHRPLAPVLGKPPRSELSKALADPHYPTDAVTRMQAERISARRNGRNA